MNQFWLQSSIHHDGYISKKALEYIHYGSQIYPDIKARDARLKVHYLIKQTQC